jgi:hypothetical protein
MGHVPAEQHCCSVISTSVAVGWVADVEEARVDLTSGGVEVDV